LEVRYLLIEFQLGIGKREAMKQKRAATTMLGPAGVSHSSDPFRPIKTEIAPIIEAMTAMCSGEVENRRAVAAGIISSAVISRTPNSQ
jgi:hypothetical protein